MTSTPSMSPVLCPWPASPTVTWSPKPKAMHGPWYDVSTVRFVGIWGVKGGCIFRRVDRGNERQTQTCKQSARIMLAGSQKLVNARGMGRTELSCQAPATVPGPALEEKGGYSHVRQPPYRNLTCTLIKIWDQYPLLRFLEQTFLFWCISTRFHFCIPITLYWNAFIVHESDLIVYLDYDSISPVYLLALILDFKSFTFQAEVKHKWHLHANQI